MFLRTNIDMNTLHIFWMIFWMNAKCNSRSWLKTFCISKRKSRGCGNFSIPLISTWKSGMNAQFLLLYRPISFQVAVNTFNFSWPHLNGKQNNSCPILDMVFAGRSFFFQGLLINLLLPLLAELTVLPAWVSTLKSYLFSRRTMPSPFVFIRKT